jgi:oligopeptide transport system permease protein
LTTKEWFNRGRRVNQRIEILQKQRREEYERITSITARLDGDVVDGTKDPHKFDRYTELDDMIGTEIRALLGIKCEIKAVIAESFPISARLGVSAMIVALLLGTVLGSTAALMRNKLPDRLIVFLSTLFTAGPGFILASLLLLLFCIKLQWFPVWDASNQSYFLPVLALSAYPMAYITRLSKTSMLDALSQDYIRTARAKGVSRFKMIFKHALRNSLIPVITYVGPQIAYIITGSMVIETIFTVGGLGSKFVSGINNRDYTLIMATTIFLAVLMVAANLICDLLYKLVDPRIKYD